VNQQHFSVQNQSMAEQRLDHFLVESLPQYSRSRLQALIKDGLVRVDGEPASKAGQTLTRGAVVDVTVPASAPTALRAEHFPLDVIFENSDVMVVNKPAGLVVHPGAGHSTGTLVHAALGHDPAMQGVGGDERPGVVHRLDKATSGLILLAKNDVSLHWLQEQFQARSVEKTYLALVDGKPPTASGRIEAPIGRDPSHRKQMAIVVEGKGRAAVTEYRTLEEFSQHTLLELHPLTGRTHQIRLHCAFLGCPVVGDTVYGRKKISLRLDRHFLHASRLAVTLPGEVHRREFSAGLPDELETVLRTLRGEGGEGR
jgi:23S rRNA pseudouridine1911/1915/1917 synthase